MNYYVAGVEFSSENSLAHHGIKGQKWGVRRFQNPDGTYTQAGKMRYSKSYGPVINYQNREGLLTNAGKKKYGELLELNEETKKARDVSLKVGKKYAAEAKKLIRNKNLLDEYAEYYARNEVGLEDKNDVEEFKDWMYNTSDGNYTLVSQYAKYNPDSKIFQLSVESNKAYRAYSKNRDEMAKHILNSIDVNKFPSEIQAGIRERNVWTKGRDAYLSLQDLQFRTDLYFDSETAFAMDSGDKERLKELRSEKKKIFS